ncbi:MAG: hypothetical protein HY062_00095 [Bacteroidetes bacterium]|nr:hypothetical protein [Bacteroidota bacterium]
MNIETEIRTLNKIGQNELKGISDILFHSFEIKKDYRDKKTINKKEFLIEGFVEYLKKYLELNPKMSRKDKLEIIHFIDKLKIQTEILELLSGNLTESGITIAGKRLGKKSQSAF